jgi:hypothetical protein
VAVSPPGAYVCGNRAVAELVHHSKQQLSLENIVQSVQPCNVAESKASEPGWKSELPNPPRIFVVLKLAHVAAVSELLCARLHSYTFVTLL